VFCLLVVLVELSVLAKWLARKTSLRKPNRGEGIISIKPRPKKAYDCVGLLYYFCSFIAWCLCFSHGPVWYISYFCGMMWPGQRVRSIVYSVCVLSSVSVAVFDRDECRVLVCFSNNATVSSRNPVAVANASDGDARWHLVGQMRLLRLVSVLLCRFLCLLNP